MDELCIILVALMIGARIGGVFLGMIGGLGVGVMVFIFGLTPSTPPIDVILIILSVVLAAASLQASGGLDLLVKLAEKISASSPPLHYVISTVYLLYSHFYVRNGACRL
ncbi:anaerobic c4-dicarboxylate transporter [Salmonella enterica subsp. arizonae]|uniref:Anaerobic c4-dicarboxylate transporter n=1 Tax=Salmonella enterica subsp. arizonae TaxID=59203 RepID=A0A379RXH1_SALER|nr:anaerobic c4-dicarboxylate transporter [Salmonella enterica subsp. arizonae]